MHKSKNPYEILGVSKNATIDEIKTRHRKLVKETHPDKNPGKENEFNEIQNAFALIGTVFAKNKYDNGECSRENPNSYEVKKLMVLNECIVNTFNHEDCSGETFVDGVLFFLDKKLTELKRNAEILRMKKRTISEVIKCKWKKNKKDTNSIKNVGENIIDEVNMNLNTIKEGIQICNECIETVQNWD